MVEFERKQKFLNYILFIAIFVVFGIALYFLIPFILSAISSISILSAETCTTQECFITAANECKKVKMEQIEAGSLFEYLAKDCVLTKTAKKLNETEPKEMKELLEGESMKCSYAKGSFNENWIKTLSVDIDDCSGELKDAIKELIFVT